MSERLVPAFLCNNEFNNQMLNNFITFYNNCVADNKKNAIIYIDSPGGNVHILNSMLSLIESSSITFHTVAIGQAYSCGLLLLAGGDVRYATDRSEMMFHDISSCSWGHPDQMEDDLNRNKKISEQVMTKFADRTKKPIKWWMGQYLKNPNRYFWLNANQSKMYGVIDKIGVPVEKTKTDTIVDVEK